MVYFFFTCLQDALLKGKFRGLSFVSSFSRRYFVFEFLILVFDYFSFVRAYGTLPTSNIKVTTSQLKESRAKEVSQTPDSLQLDTYEQVEAKINDPKESFMAVADSYKRYLQRLQMEESGPANSNHFSVYDGLARQPFTIDQYFNFIKGSEYDPDNWTIDQLEEFYFVPHPEPFSMGLYLQNLVAYRTLRR